MDLEPSGGLVQLVAGPIGNLGDITYRAVEALRRADLIACEDTRHSQRLLAHYEIAGKPLVALHEHNEARQAEELAERVAQRGERLAFLSDAGSPAISDPGFRLVRSAIARGITVEVLPGPSAVLTGLIGSGLATDRFDFGGFLPVKAGKREKALDAALGAEGTSIFFESPHRIRKTLAAIDALAPDRPVCVARELTKKFETYHRGTAAEILADWGEAAVKGEITLLVEGLTRASRKREREAVT